MGDRAWSRLSGLAVVASVGFLTAGCSDPPSNRASPTATTPTATSNRARDLEPLASNAPVDRIVKGHDPTSDPKTRPLIEQARSELTSVRERYLHGLGPGEHLFVTTILRSPNHNEVIFVGVGEWSDPDRIQGLIAVTPTTKGFHEGDVLPVKREEIIDWTISRADGSEEGNLLGKYQDSQH